MTKIADTFYAKYIKERERIELLESDFGFITYRIAGPECFIVDMYVDKASRKAGRARELLAQLAEIAKECEVMTANIWIKKTGAQETLRMALAYGFEVKSGGAEVLLLAMNLLEA